MKKQKIYLEHANITVSSIESAVKFFQTAFPHFVEKGGGHDKRKWIHFGDDYTYVALNEPISNNMADTERYDDLGINHVGFVVENVDEIALRLLASGYHRSYPRQLEKYRVRDYFLDPDGNEFEFVEYLSEKIEERNSYQN